MWAARLLFKGELLMLAAMLIFILGMVIGSFLNVCIYRLPRGGSLISPVYSACPQCNKRLQLGDLIPLLSFLFLKGSCRYCQKKISPQYFLVELLTGILFLLAYLRFGLSGELLSYLLFISLLVIATFIDLEHQIIPNTLNLFGVVGGFILNLLTGHLGVLPMLVGLLVAGGLMLIIAILSRGGMGGGDIKLAGVIGVFLGWQLALFALFSAFIIGGIGGGILLALKRKGRKDMIPFGPFLALGALVAIFAGQEIIAWYLQTLN